VLVRSVGPTTNTALETTNEVGDYSSVAIGLDGNPVISHTDATDDDLEFAKAYLVATGITYQ